MKRISRDESIQRITATACTLVILLILAWALLHVPVPGLQSPGARERPAMQVTFLARTPEQAPAPPPQAVRAPDEPHRQPQSRQRPTQQPRTPVPERKTAKASTRDNTAAALYSRDGRVRMAEIDPMDPGYAATPPGTTNQRELDRAHRLLNPPNPVQYHETQFNKDWVSDGTLGDVAMQAMNRGMKKAQTAIYGEEPQTVKARPPPDVRFNPALAENQADLGSEATGDAYKAAPIAHEDVPDTKGGASSKIRTELAQVEKLPTQCAAPRKKALLAPIHENLTALVKAEHALNHGADPVMAAQMLPRQLDRAYDLARRALWYARKQLAQCGS